MRFSLVACAIAALACGSSTAFAQKHGGGGGGRSPNSASGNDTPSGAFVIEHNNGTAAALGRSRAAAGDCKAALDAFDAALESSVDPELHRDRGICHEKLGNAFPAIDDYRFYLTARPNANDSDRIRDRLDALMADNGQTPADKSAVKSGSDGSDGSAKPAKKHDPDDPNTPTADDVHSDASASVSLGNADTDNGKSIDAIDADEKLNAEADSSALRKGKGFILGPYFDVRKWGKSSFGWGEAVGASARYSFGAPSTLIAELGYSSVNSSGSDSSLGGLMLFGGYEARVGIDPRYKNAMFFGGGLGYERLTLNGTGQVFSIFMPRVRGGFRHVFGPSIGLEIGLDAGYAFITLLDNNSANSTADSLVVAGTVALLVGF